MKISSTKLQGIAIIETLIAQDPRGDFMKVFHKETFEQQGLDTSFEESYYSTSKKDVIRGMHFQTPPEDHAKVVYVTSGEIVDVVLDIRKGSPTFGQFETFELNDVNRKAIYIPSGFAHGFISLRDNTAVTYLQTTMRSAQNEGGIRFDSFGMNWGVVQPILSVRDQQFPTWKEFSSPFAY
jgi:dTDP-4-dehydrorhamnose 3,5-epimerase